MNRLLSKGTIAFGLIALAGVRAILRAIPEGNSAEWRAQYAAYQAHVPPAVSLPEDVLLEECACVNGEPCVSCWDLGYRPHDCAA